MPYLEGLDVYRKTVGDSAPLVSIVRINLTDNYYVRGDYGLSTRCWGKSSRARGTSKGEDLPARTLDARTRAFKPSLRWTAETQSALGENLTAQKRYDEAEPLLGEGHQTLEAAPGRQDPGPREARRRLFILYEVLGRPAEAARLGRP